MQPVLEESLANANGGIVCQAGSVQEGVANVNGSIVCQAGSVQEKMSQEKRNTDSQALPVLVDVTAENGKTNTCTTVGYYILITLIVLMVMSIGSCAIAKIAMGAVFFNDCSGVRMIPIYLVVSGVLPCFACVCYWRGKKVNELGIWDLVGILVFVFHVIWLICGSVWVYPNYRNLVECWDSGAFGCYRGVCWPPLLTFATQMVTTDWVWLAIIMCILAWFFCKLFGKLNTCLGLENAQV